MKIDIAALSVAEGEKVSLTDRPTRVEPLCADEDEYEAADLGALQQKLYAAGTRLSLRSENEAEISPTKRFRFACETISP